VRAVEQVDIKPTKVNDRELKLASQLIDSITTDKGFDASKYKNDVKERIEALIKQKVSGREITAPEAPVAPQGARVIDLMEALRASLSGKKGAAKSTARAAGAAPVRRAAKRPTAAAPRTSRKAASPRVGRRAA
jgi:DNA end-binding protein Ku